MRTQRWLAPCDDPPSAWPAARCAKYVCAVYGIAVSVTACLRGGTRVDVAWNLDTALTPRFDPADAVGVTPGGGKLGALLGGALDSRLIELASAKPTSGRVVEIELDAIESSAVGVEAGTVVRILVAPAHTLPEELWDQLLERQTGHPRGRTRRRHGHCDHDLGRRHRRQLGRVRARLSGDDVESAADPGGDGTGSHGRRCGGGRRLRGLQRRSSATGLTLRSAWPVPCPRSTASS